MPVIIYKTTNLINGNYYIGQDSKNNKQYLGSGKLLNKAIKKYGRDNFQKEILEYCNSKDELNEREIFWINKLHPIYNIARGGNGGDTYTNHPEYDVIIKKLKGRMSWSKGLKRPELEGDSNPSRRSEVREKIRQAKLENPTQMFGNDNPAKRLDVRNKISENVSKSWQSRILIKCPYCNKESINAANMSRWHFDKCKQKL